MLSFFTTYTLRFLLFVHPDKKYATSGSRRVVHFSFFKK
jgi:hypothetical protein